MADILEQLQTTLGSAYTIERELGGDGMSRVFLGRDTALQRPVVIKLLPEYAAASLSAERFRREIAVAAKLQHPHIVPVLSAGETQGLPFYTMPFVEGRSLRERLNREGELAIDEVVQILKEVARALAYAHEHGIVHRDIKPDNVMLSGGASMVTDFGVAKAVSDSSASTDQASLTQLGVALGTPAYMAPEQARGDAILDHRADLYSLGCVGYELLTGQPPFAGRGAQATLAAHVTEAAEPVEKRRPSVPPALAAVVMQCLEKRPADRPRNATELLRSLDAVVVTPLRTNAHRITAAGVPSSAERSWIRDPRTIALIGIVAVGVWVWGMTRAALSRRERGSVYSMLAFIDGTEPSYGRGFALSPNGRTIVFVGRAADTAAVTLWLRDLDSPVAAPVLGTTNAQLPFWSPDGRRLGYFANGMLHVRELSGSNDRALCQAQNPEGGSWGSRGVIVYAPQTRGTIWAVNASGGECVSVTMLDSGVLDHRRPSFLPDGRHFVFGSGSAATIFLGDLETKRQSVLLRGFGYGAWVAPGYLLFGKPLFSQLFAQRMDPDRLRLEGDAVPFLDDFGFTASGRPLFSANESTLVAVVARSSKPSLVLLNRAGAIQRTVVFADRISARGFFPSRDGSKIAVSGNGLWLYDVARDVTSLLVAGSDTGALAIGNVKWSPLDTMILYSPMAGPDLGIRAYHFRSGRDSAVAPSPSTILWVDDWSRDGRRILTHTTDASAGAIWNVSMLDLATGKWDSVFVRRPSSPSARFSPADNWLVFTSNEAGRSELFVMNLLTRLPIQVTHDGGIAPQWVGREIFYQSLSGMLMAVSVDLGERPRFGTPRVVFSNPSNGPIRVSSDGRTIYGWKSETHQALALIQNWPSRIRRR